MSGGEIRNTPARRSSSPVVTVAKVTAVVSEPLRPATCAGPEMATSLDLLLFGWTISIGASVGLDMLRLPGNSNERVQEAPWPSFNK
jgi:hypothetical protein